MSHTCCVDGCQTSGRASGNVFHRFPRDVEIKSKWLDTVPMKSGVPAPRICSGHFLEEDFKSVRGKRILNFDAVPTVFQQVAKEHLEPENSIVDNSDVACDKNVILNGSNEFNNLEDVGDNGGINNCKENSVEVNSDIEHKDNIETSNIESSLESNLVCTQVSGTEQREDDFRQEDGNLKLSSEVDPDVNGASAIKHCDIKLKSNELDRKHADDIENDDLSEVEDKIDSACQEADRNDEDEKFDEIRHTIDEKRRKAKREEILNDKNRIANREENSDGKAIKVLNNKMPEFDQRLDLEDNIPSFIIQDNNIRSIEIEVPVEEHSQFETEVENMEVSIDPTFLMMEEQVVEEQIIEEEILISDSEGDKRDSQQAVSLLTSSDEDDVIVLEPKYDVVEVSDETDEEDRPLISLISSLRCPKQGSAVAPIAGKIRKYFCTSCHYMTNGKNKFMKHIKQHSNLSVHSCCFCDYVSASSKKYAKHIRNHDTEKRYKCHMCTFKARHHMSLLYHMASHDNLLKEPSTGTTVDSSSVSPYDWR